MLTVELLQFQEKTFGYLRKKDVGNISDDELEEIIAFMQKELNSAGPGTDF